MSSLIPYSDESSEKFLALKHHYEEILKLIEPNAGREGLVRTPLRVAKILPADMKWIHRPSLNLLCSRRITGRWS